MNSSSLHPDAQILESIGQKIAHLRLQSNLTQQALAEQAGIGLRTLQRMELGSAAAQFSSFIRVCRVLGILPRLEAIFPDPEPSPIALLKRDQRSRKRSRTKPTNAKTWTWGDEG